jgi:TolB protein
MPGKTIRELEDAFEQLRERLLRGDLTEGEFQASVQQLHFEDDQGHQWQLGWYTGKWYRCDQGWWSPATPPEPGVAQASPGARTAKGRHWRPITPWLVAPLVILLLLAGVLLVTGWNITGWGGASAPFAQVTTTPGASLTRSLASPTAAPPQAPSSPTLSSPSATPSPVMTRKAATSDQTGAAALTETPDSPATASPPATADASTPTSTPVSTTNTPTPVSSPTASPIPSPTRTALPAPSPKPTTVSFSGRVFFPVYDPEPARRTFDIYAVRLASGKREPVAGQASQPAISPDGQRLAYRSWETGQQGLVVLELEDGRTWRWVDSAEAARPSWSPDNQNIVFPSQQESDRLWRIYRTVGREYVQIRRYGSDMLGRVPIWLGDGRIVYWDCPLANCGLYVMGGDGSDPVRLTTAEHDTGPAASPDGQQVAFMSNRSGNWDIYVIDSHAPPGTEPTRLTDHAARDGLPAWSPNGKWLAFASDRGGSWAVWAVRPDGRKLQKLFELGGTLDGKTIYAQASDQSDWTSETIAWGP